MKPEKQLYQWDTNQSLVELTPFAQYVDYPIGDEVIRIKADGTRCRIPDEVLQTYGGKTCYERYPDGTYRAYSFTVLYAPKPPDYVYTPEERTTFEALTARVDAAIAEIKRRADSGEFTPKKGVDYFTDAEKAEMMESVSDGAIGEFRKVVDSATTEYNDNHNLQLAKYNANASEKLTTYDTNAEQHTTDYNRNAEQKLEAYNQNHTEKVAEYNQNAETKTAEFDSNAAALQTEVDRLRGECDTLAAENRKQENRIDALMKLNKGQTYDILAEEGETASRTAPSGAKYVSVDKVGGKSVVEGGAIVSSTTAAVELEGKNLWDDSDPAFMQVLLNAGFLYNSGVWHTNNIIFSSVNIGTIPPQSVLSYDILADAVSNPRIELFSGEIRILPRSFESTGKWIHHNLNIPSGTVIDRIVLNYASRGTCKIKNIQLERGTTETAYSPHTKQSLSTGFPELKSAGTAHDEIDMDGGEIRRSVGVVDLGTLDWTYNSEYKFMLASVDGKRAGHKNLIISRYNLSANELWQQGTDGIYGGNEQNNIIYVKDLNYSDPAAFKVAISGVMLHYELETPTTESVTIPAPLQEWLPVEAGGTVTFRNSDDTKQLPVPNAVSWVRKLNEVE